MSKRDVLDKEMAQRFAWRTAPPLDMGREEKPSASEEEAPEPSEPELSEEEREDMLRACAVLARQAARAWELAPGEEQRSATEALVERAEAMSFDIVGMGEYPRETVRLLRLLVRYYRELPARARETATHTLSFAPVSPREREVVDLLVEAAEVGDPALVFLMDSEAASEALAKRYPELGERLLCILDDEEATWASRETAARWLSLAAPKAAIPSLQRALRAPHLGLRWTALLVLLDMSEPGLTEADVLWLLEDALIHPLPPWRGSDALETTLGYEDALIEAVGKLRPEGGLRPLEILADGGGVHIRRRRHGLDTGFALRALAAGYPEHAVARIDRALFRSWSMYRSDAVKAAAILPEELARPRLFDAAAGPDYYAAEHARELWFSRFGEECPSPPLEGIDVELLSEPPSEAFLASLVVLRGSSTDAAGALLVVLLADGPGRAAGAAEEGGAVAPRPAPSSLSAADREALALVLFSLRDFGLAHRREGLPSGEEAWAFRLIERFGEPALLGLLSLAARGARAGFDNRWLSALASLAQKGVLTGPYRDKLRDLATSALRSAAWDGDSSPLYALTAVGVPPELYGCLFPIAMRPAAVNAVERRFSHARVLAADLLRAAKDAPALDERILREAEDALGRRSYGELLRRVNLGCRRQLAPIFDLVGRCLAALDEDPALFEVADIGAHSLRDVGRIDEAWILRELREPESLRFAIATHLCRGPTSPEALSALERGLGSPARGGAAAAEAAEALVAIDALGVSDPRLDDILERAPLGARASLIEMLLRCGAPVSPLGGYIEGVLVSADEKAARTVYEALYRRSSTETAELFKAAMQLGPNPSVREGVTRQLGEPSEAELYFQDHDGEDDESNERNERN